MQLTGIHHLTAVSAQIRDNHRFYTQAVGMRLVKRSVNQDDVSAYHLFYADARGTPGTDLTFFDFAVPREIRGSHSITRTHLRVDGLKALEFWAAHFDDVNVPHEPIVERDGRLTLDFEDPEGQRLSFVDDGGEGDVHPWSRSPIPEVFQVRGLGPIVMTVPDLTPTDTVLQRVAAMRPVREYADPASAKHRVHVYEMGGGGAGGEVHLAVRPDLRPGRPGAGGVHHVAFRTPDDDYDAWADRLNTLGMPNSGKVDRFWFRSLYFREPNGVLFEIASDGPGFGIDEDSHTLGEKVVLPPFLEPHRAEIVANLKSIE